MLYDGPWTLEGMADFVRDKGKHEIDVFGNTTTSRSQESASVVFRGTQEETRRTDVRYQIIIKVIKKKFGACPAHLSRSNPC